MTSPTEFARSTPGVGVKDWERQVDMGALRRYRLARLQQQIVAHDCAAALLFGSVNVRYATGTRFAQVFNLHSPFRSAFVPASGRITMHDWERMHVEGMEEVIREVRDARIFTFFPAGERHEDFAEEWAGEVDSLLREVGGDNRRLAVDIIEPVAMLALQRRGIDVISAEQIVELACAIKSNEELVLMAQTASIAEAGFARMREHLRPGATENEIWAHLHFTNVAAGGEWIEYRLCASGGRTNPWGQECSDRVVRAGELLGVDAGMIGPWGYGTDMSRTFFCPPGRPSDEQKRLYSIAYEHVQHNLALVKAGATFRDLSHTGYVLPDEFVKNRYSMAFHGVGMGDEWPSIPYAIDWERQGYDGVLEQNMVITVEAFVGSEHGGEGVKLEEMVVVTEDGYQLLTTFPYEEDLLG